MPNVTKTVTRARSVGETLASDEEFRKSLVDAYESARKIYDRLDDKSVKALAAMLATDTRTQRDVSRSVTRMQKAARKATRKTHRRRNTLILAGIVVGLLYNPKTGPQTRKWIRERTFGSDETFEYEVDGSVGESPTSQTAA